MDTDGPEYPDSQRPRGTPIPHDQLLKTLLLTFFSDLLELVDPELAHEVDPQSLESLDKELFTDLPTGRRREVDLLVRARLRRGDPRLILVHVEVERQFRSRHIARMPQYYFQLRGRFPNEPIFPIAVYLRGGPPGHQVLTWSETVVGFEVLRFNYHALGLSQDLAEHHLERMNPLGWALASLMGSQRYRPSQLKLECLRRIARGGFDEARTFLLANIVETYLKLTGAEAQRFNKALSEVANEEVKAMQHTWEEKHYYRGREEGIARGREEGVARGTRRSLIQLLEHRFGVAESVRQRLQAIDDPETLERLVARALTAKSLSDLELDD